ncbi:DUF3383 domain-containing protein [Alkalihalophilus marmarensis]|uniref:DUF3383 family protein n=1 Tax=Alkalihalophilus marmarensis TaxID=521377 RepID=UPI0020411DF2|nr:DUF3383 family protein [Alkalihalophilus marmarensis]MCM3488780.1 DUF3383 domain-containing protein [Alkalihalophilus marmarensis]
MPLKDVSVEITLATRPISRLGFGKPLILTSGGYEYQEFRGFNEAVETLNLTESTKLYKAIEAIYKQKTTPAVFAVVGHDEEQTPLERLEEVIEEDFYFIYSTTEDPAQIEAISDYINGEGVGNVEINKVYAASTESDTIAGTLQAKDHSRSFVFYAENEDENPALALITEAGSKEVGSVTWKNQILEGVTPSELSVAELQAIHDQGAIAFVTKAGDNVTSEGKMVNGEYIDVIHSKDFVQLSMEHDLQKLLNTVNKVPLTNAGIAQVTSVVESVLKRAYNQGVIAEDDDGNPMYTVTAPSRSDLTQEDRANRRLPGINFEFYLSGAVHEVPITGTIRA